MSHPPAASHGTSGTPEPPTWRLLVCEEPAMPAGTGLGLVRPWGLGLVFLRLDLHIYCIAGRDPRPVHPAKTPQAVCGSRTLPSFPRCPLRARVATQACWLRPPLGQALAQPAAWEVVWASPRGAGSLHRHTVPGHTHDAGLASNPADRAGHQLRVWCLSVCFSRNDSNCCSGFEIYCNCQCSRPDPVSFLHQFGKNAALSLPQLNRM